MSLRWIVCCAGLAGGLAALPARPSLAGENHAGSFRAILELAEIGPDVLARIADVPDCSEEDWQVLLQVFDRLQQFERLDSSGSRWASPVSLGSAQDREEKIGQIFDLAGTLTAVEALPLPERLAAWYGRKSIYLCRLGQGTVDSGEVGVATVLTTNIPQRWHKQKRFNENVRVRGVLLKLDAGDTDPGWKALLLTNHIAWYPLTDVPTGQQLLARHGMDVALLDEVRHRQPFVKPDISREGEAFYAALTALGKVDQQELVRLAVENVARRAANWRALQPELRRHQQQLQAQLAGESNASQREKLEREVKAARDRRGIAAAVVELSASKRSSVAPLFLQPQEEVGELVCFEGVAHRAVRIAVGDERESAPRDSEAAQLGINAYYEMEIFTADSQNLPIVCCVRQLPADFPSGDEIREPVRIAGVFFKNWRYRSRRLVKQAGATGEQRQLYTPVVLGKLPTWLPKTSRRNGRWAVWGGSAFLGMLIVVWIGMAWLAKRDRAARATVRRAEIIDL